MQYQVESAAARSDDRRRRLRAGGQRFFEPGDQNVMDDEQEEGQSDAGDQQARAKPVSGDETDSQIKRVLHRGCPSVSG